MEVQFIIPPIKIDLTYPQQHEHGGQSNQVHLSEHQVRHIIAVLAHEVKHALHELLTDKDALRNLSAQLEEETNRVNQAIKEVTAGGTVT